MNTLEQKSPVGESMVDSQSPIANGQLQTPENLIPHDFGGLWVIVYSGPHYGRAHRVVGYTGTTLEVLHGSGDRLFAPLCDCEVLPEEAA
jgi:hypothetical protein